MSPSNIFFELVQCNSKCCCDTNWLSLMTCVHGLKGLLIVEVEGPASACGFLWFFFIFSSSLISTMVRSRACVNKLVDWINT